MPQKVKRKTAMDRLFKKYSINKHFQHMIAFPVTPSVLAKLCDISERKGKDCEKLIQEILKSYVDQEAI